MLSWIVAVVTALVLLTAGTLYFGFSRRIGKVTRQCPACRVEMEPLIEGGDPARLVRAYEVLVCPHCTNAATAVMGEPGAFAWCPGCRERSLQTPCIRLPRGPGGPAVEVHEHCELCGYHETVKIVQGGAHAPRGLVIPFPTERRRKSG